MGGLVRRLWSYDLSGGLESDGLSPGLWFVADRLIDDFTTTVNIASDIITHDIMVRDITISITMCWKGFHGPSHG